MRVERGGRPHLQPYLLGGSYSTYHALNRADVTEEQVQLTILPALRQIVGRHVLKPETAAAALRDSIKVKRMHGQKNASKHRIHEGGLKLID